MINRFLLTLFLGCLAAAPAPADEGAAPSPIVFIYDSSGSMWGQIDGTSKVEIAREVMADTVADLPEGQRVGLVAYGHRSEGDCEDVETLLTGAGTGAVTPALEAIRPLGKTPLAWSATLVMEQLRRDGEKATVILLTDGIESCGGDLCDVVKAARESGVDFVMHIVGFGLKPGETGPLECAAEAGGGRYFDAGNAQELAAGMTEAMARTVDQSGNVSVVARKNDELVDAYVEAFAAGDDIRVQAARTYHKGALFHLPPGRYDLKVTALEDTDLQPLWVRNIATTEEAVSEHEVSFDAGTVRFHVTNNGEGWDSLVKLLSGDGVVAQTRTYGRPGDMEVPPGDYRAEVQALVVKGLVTAFDVSDITVEAGEVTAVEYPFQTGTALIGVRQGDTLVDAVVNIEDRATGTGVAGARTYTSEGSNPREFILMPGDYTVKISTLGAHQGHNEVFDMTLEGQGTFEKTVELTP